MCPNNVKISNILSKFCEHNKSKSIRALNLTERLKLIDRTCPLNLYDCPLSLYGYFQSFLTGHA